PIKEAGGHGEGDRRSQRGPEGARTQRDEADRLRDQRGEPSAEADGHQAEIANRREIVAPLTGGGGPGDREAEGHPGGDLAEGARVPRGGGGIGGALGDRGGHGGEVPDRGKGCQVSRGPEVSRRPWAVRPDVVGARPSYAELDGVGVCRSGDRLVRGP